MNSSSNLVVKSLEELLNCNLSIPIYQRPYEWSRANVLTLLDDIHNEYIKGKSINLGTIILYSNADKLDIVDGQQRIITLSLLFYNLNLESKILKNSIQCISNTEKRIISNSNEIEDYLERLRKNPQFDIENFKNYIQKQINFFVIITEDSEESFQLFDGRNSKFKNLDPVDLLKAYHLGKINRIDEKKESLISWNENINDSFSIDNHKNRIQFLFNDVLFNIYNWSLNKGRKEFEKDDIYLYKGYRESKGYNYVKYYNSAESKYHLINKPFKEGKAFFDMVADFIKEYKNIIDDYNLYKKVINDTRVVDYPRDYFDSQYYFINIVYYDALFLFKNKFGSIQEFEMDTIQDYIYKWVLTHRVNYLQVQYTSINKYIIENNNFFFECNNALDISELYKLNFNELIEKQPSVKNNNSYLDKTRSKLWEKLK